MATFDELIDLLTVRLAELADRPDTPEEFEDGNLKELIADHTGPAKAAQVVSELWSSGFLEQIRADPITFLPTRALFRRAEELTAAKSTNSDLVGNAVATTATDQTIGRESSRTEPRFTDFRSRLTIALYKKSNDEGMQIYNLKELADENELSYRDGWIKEFEKFLGDHGYAMVRGVMGGDDRCGAQINADGLAYAEELIDELQNGVGTGDYEVPFTFELAGHDETIADKEGVPITAIPASDRMVSLDHNSETYKGAVGAIDQVITAVSGDNEYGASAPEEKAALVGALRAGRSLLDAVEVKVAAVQATLLPALQYVADNFAKGAVAALGAVAVAAVLTLIGVI